jgi:type I restriction enzyme M protein
MIGALPPADTSASRRRRKTDFDFEETMREIHGELADLNTEAAELATTIAKNFEALLI